MGGNLNALGIILVIVLTAAMLVRGGTWAGSLRRFPLAVVIACVVMVLASVLTTVLAYEVDPSHQWLIPSACLALLLTFTRPGHRRMVAALAVAVSTFVLSNHVLLLVGGPGSYTSSPRGTRWIYEANSRSHLHRIRSWLDVVAEDDDHTYPAGWLAEPPLRRLVLADDLHDTRSETVEIHPFWHTPLTGLYRKRYHEVQLWYPGGRLKEGLKGLEFRPR